MTPKWDTAKSFYFSLQELTEPLWQFNGVMFVNLPVPCLTQGGVKYMSVPSLFLFFNRQEIYIYIYATFHLKICSLSKVIMSQLLAYWFNIMYWENNSSFLKG